MTTSNVENTTVETVEKVQAPFYQIKSVSRELKEELNANLSLLEKIANKTASVDELIEFAEIVSKNIEITTNEPSKRGRKPSPEVTQKKLDKERDRIQKKIQYIEQKQSEYDALKDKNTEKAFKLLGAIKKSEHDIDLIQEEIENLQVKLYNIVSPDSQAA